MHTRTNRAARVVVESAFVVGVLFTVSLTAQQAGSWDWPREISSGEADLNHAPPRIIVRIEPALLILTDGNIEMAPIEGNEILDVGNTDSDVVFEVASQSYCVLLSGRWYRSKDLDRGPWPPRSPPRSRRSRRRARSTT